MRIQITTRAATLLTLCSLIRSYFQDVSKFGPQIMNVDPNDPNGMVEMLRAGGLDGS